MSALNAKFFKRVEEQHARYERAYRELLTVSGEALRLAKRAIFSFHRGEFAAGKKLLREAGRKLKSIEVASRKEPELLYEGSYRAALEEFVEAHLFAQFLSRKTIGPIADFKNIDAEVFLGGLSDLTGELVRYAVGRATAGDSREALRAHAALVSAMEALIKLDLAGPLRNKFDQAKNSLRRMEEIIYDLKLSRGV